MAESSHVFDATQNNFSETDVMQASLTAPVLVDFWAPWCAPCKTLGPLLEKIVASYNGAIKLAKVDTDNEMQLAAMFGIRSLPTVVLVKDGQMIDGFMGALPESGIREFLDRHGVIALDGGDEAQASETEAVEEVPTRSSKSRTCSRTWQLIPTNPRSNSIWPWRSCVQVSPTLRKSSSMHWPAKSWPPMQEAKLLARTNLDFAHALKACARHQCSCGRASRKILNDHEARDLLAGIRLLIDGDSAAGLDEFLNILQTQRDWKRRSGQEAPDLPAFSMIDDEDLVGAYRRRMASLLF